MLAACFERALVSVCVGSLSISGRYSIGRYSIVSILRRDILHTYTPYPTQLSEKKNKKKDERSRSGSVSLAASHSAAAPAVTLLLLQTDTHIATSALYTTTCRPLRLLCVCICLCSVFLCVWRLVGLIGVRLLRVVVSWWFEW